LGGRPASRPDGRRPPAPPKRKRGEQANLALMAGDSLQAAGGQGNRFTQPLRAGAGFTWHMLGHLQSNKAKKAVALFDFVHSVDSLHLVDVLHKETIKINKHLKMLIQVNVSGEDTKSGIKIEELDDFYKESRRITSTRPASCVLRSASDASRQGGTQYRDYSLPSETTHNAKSDQQGGLIIAGLMTMAPFTDAPETTRPYFRKLRELLDELKNKYHSEDLKYLSMGMSQDFEIAIEEGANIVRIGTAIFNPL
ncbi:MAG: YggS family pyridoxal phosphate enzyme, partial [Planctomycetota bacterium]|nr:YggS family pyridoxal phosphate enzyme [Planctomycetota bacterium]